LTQCGTVISEPMAEQLVWMLAALIHANNWPLG
jgi:hypothetical protein